MNTVLVLGAGGVAGWVFHAGVLRGLVATGLDPRTADLVIGTSAGAAIAAGLRAGTDPEHILDSVTRGPTDEERAAYREQVAARERTFRPLAPSLLRHALPGGNGLAVAVAGLLPPGWFPTASMATFPGVDAHDSWPSGLWIPSVQVDEGEVVVFGRDRHDVGVHEAVEASSAVPGLFQPTRIGSNEFIDGGLASPTHADLAIDSNADIVLVSSPMTRPTGRPMARFARRRLDQERNLLTAAGKTVVVIEPPSAEDFRGFPRRNPTAAPRIAEVGTRAALQAVGGFDSDDRLAG